MKFRSMRCQYSLGSRAVTRSFKTLEWPVSPVIMDPPDGQTLVNFDTYFFTSNAGATTRLVTLAGRSVTIRATPVSYAWSFGDGTEATTASAGAPHPEGDVVHVFVEKGEFEPSVDTTYGGEFRIGDGEWRAINAQVTVQGPTAQLTTLEATPELVTDPGE